jgi:hypothetical protein
MPIRKMSASELVQFCPECGAEHSISLDRGAQKTKRGPFALEDGSTLDLSLDEGQALTVSLHAADFSALHNASAVELARAISAATPALVAREDFGGCLIESRKEGAASRVLIRGGSACERLGLRLAAAEDASHVGRPPVLGLVTGEFRDPHLILLRPCPCGLNEILIRNFDQAPAHVAWSFFDRHRRAVNTLAEILKRTGRSHPELAAHHARETTPPPDLFTEMVAGEQAIDLTQSRPSVGKGE